MRSWVVPAVAWSRTRLFIVVAPGLAALVAMVLHAPIPQDQSYHCFADGRTLFGIPNFWNVLTNLPFVVTGAIGLGWVVRADARADGLRLALAVFFSGVLLTGFGSAYYHWDPTNATLFWDRLPLTFAFMSLFALAIRDRVGARAGAVAFWPLIVVGPASILWWHATDDLRWYALVQFYPMLAIPLLLCLFRGLRFRTRDWVVIVACYALAKLTELTDHQIHHVLGFSGHSIKHLAAAGAPWWVWRMADRGVDADGVQGRHSPSTAA